MHRMLVLMILLIMVCSVVGVAEVNLAESRLEGKGGIHASSKGNRRGKDKGPSDDSDLSSWMPVSGVGGKGGRSSKNSKASKSSNKGAKKGGNTRAPSYVKPSASPSPPSQTTPSPTSANSIPIRATPFSLFYDGAFTRSPNDDEFASVAEITRAYLEEVMTREFAQTSLTNLDDFVTFMIRTSFDIGEPVAADYRCTGLFNPSSIFLPTVRELNSLIDDFLSAENLDEYISRIQALPPSNIFSTTVGVIKGLPDVPIPLHGNSESTTDNGTNKMGVAAAASGIIVFAAGVAALRRQRYDELLEDCHNNNLKDDSASFTDETHITSLDSASSW